MLVDNKYIFEILRCPKSGRKLIKTGDRLVTEGCEEKITYSIVNSYPIMIDFDKSILEESDVASLSSVVVRPSYGGILGLIKWIASPANYTNKENVEHILNLLLSSKPVARVLVVGGGSVGEGMEPLYDDSRVELISFDIYGSPTVQLIADAHNNHFLKIASMQ